MKIISIHWNINSSVAYMEDGVMVCAISEERFSRIKNDSAFPIKSIEWILASNNLEIDDIDIWLYPSFGYSFPYQVLRRYDSFDIDDYIKEQDEYWYPRIYENKEVDYIQVFKDKIDLQQYPSDYWHKKMKGDAHRNTTFDYRIEILEQMNVDKNRIKTVEHHNCHLAYAYFTSKFAYKEEVLGLTIDGIGDGLNATVSLIDKNGNFKRVYKTGDANIGRLYRYITLLLGMKPNEHEYKVMGLAPYAKDKYLTRVKEIFEEYMGVEDGEFIIKNDIPDSYYYYRNKLKGFRFDNIAGGIQRYVEELLVKWVEQNIKKYGIKKIVLCGGVGMNIKAMGEIVKITSLEDFYVPGNPSDETNCIGAAYYYNHKIRKNTNIPLNSLYLGFKPNFDEEVYSNAKSKYTVVDNPSNSYIIEQLENYKVVGRCIGKMEFGARALGNRSLLAKSDNIDVKEKINHMIKNRDFWMPFAPIIIDKFAERYLVNTKNISSPYMTIGFDTTDEGKRALKAACHLADNTVRAQILSKEQNHELYNFIEEYSETSGDGCMLNTSFNLHGFPIVSTQKDAYYVFENSDLDCLWLDNYMIMR